MNKNIYLEKGWQNEEDTPKTKQNWIEYNLECDTIIFGEHSSKHGWWDQIKTTSM
jgi:hypothetical protein